MQNFDAHNSSYKKENEKYKEKNCLQLFEARATSGKILKYQRAQRN